MQRPHSSADAVREVQDSSGYAAWARHAQRAGELAFAGMYLGSLILDCNSWSRILSGRSQGVLSGCDYSRSLRGIGLRTVLGVLDKVR